MTLTLAFYPLCVIPMLILSAFFCAQSHKHIFTQSNFGASYSDLWGPTHPGVATHLQLLHKAYRCSNYYYFTLQYHTRTFLTDTDYMLSLIHQIYIVFCDFMSLQAKSGLINKLYQTSNIQLISIKYNEQVRNES